MLRASRAGTVSSRYLITRDGTALCTWKPAAFFGGGSFALDGRAYDVTRGGWTGRRYRLADGSGAVVATADGVGRSAWTVVAAGRTHAFERPSLLRHDQVLMRDGEPYGSVRRAGWTGAVEADLADLALPVQVFVLVSLVAVWSED